MRYSTPLLRLRSRKDVLKQLSFRNTGRDQVAPFVYRFTVADIPYRLVAENALQRSYWHLAAVESLSQSATSSNSSLAKGNASVQSMTLQILSMPTSQCSALENADLDCKVISFEQSLRLL